MSFSPTERLDLVNIGLMLLSCAVAFVIPFELFLFSYAILGPLHYLTEISWLHDKNYYTKARYDAIILMIIGLLVTLTYFNSIYNWEMAFPAGISGNLAYIAFFGSLIFVLVKNNFYRIAGLILIILTSQLSQNFALFFVAFLPTLIHVYVFTGLFMLYGALKSKSRTGLLAVVVLVLCPVLLFVLFPDANPIAVTEYGRNAYVGDMGADEMGNPRPIGFLTLHATALHEFFGVTPNNSSSGLSFWLEQVFSSKTGILVMRFIAFAYTYHYLNWFSKTRIIQWHKVPKVRFAIVVGVWVLSISIYLYNYALGLQWLFFLSFLHVLLEFPLNMTSILGIGRYFQGRIFKGGGAPVPASAGKKASH